MLSFTKVKSRGDAASTNPVVDQGIRRLDLVKFSRQATPTPPVRPDGSLTGAPFGPCILYTALLLLFIGRWSYAGFCAAA